MGGNVFKDEYDTVRLDKNQYDALCIEFYKTFGDLISLEGYHIYHPWGIIPSYKNKESFGDMDVLYTFEGACSQMEKILSDKGITAISRNSNVVSFLWNPLGYGNFQIDLIYTPHTDYRSSMFYYSYNDCGNLRGRIAHMLGLKLGHDGLKYIHRDGDQVCFEISLCKDSIQKIDRFLGFDPKKIKEFYKNGPDNLTDIFEYIASSKYFNPDIYLLHNRNHQSRIRDRKRKTYTEFLQWCENLPKDKEYFQKPENKAPFQLDAIKAFGKYDECTEKLNKHLVRKRVKASYNGEIVMDVTGLQGKGLGHFMSYLDHFLCDGIILALRPETMRNVISDLYEDYKECYGIA